MLVDLIVDSNRDGMLSAEDDGGEQEWNRSHGAIFLANVDDDDSDQIADAADEIVNGPDDALDLAQIQVAAWSTAPDAATGTFTVTASPGRVRFFRWDGASWTALGDVLPSLGPAELRAGMRFGVEGTSLLTDTSWNGRISIQLVVSDALETVLDETVAMRQAPVILPWNSAPTNTVFVSRTSDRDNAILVEAVTDATADVGIRSWPIDSTDPEYMSSDGSGGLLPDAWTQDFFDTGATYLPTEDGWQRLAVAMRLKPPMPSGYFVQKALFGPDWAYVSPFRQGSWEPTWEATDNSSLNEGGNVEVVPPHEGYPAGRIIVGSHLQRAMDPTMLAFFDAQYAQAPALTLDTRWLVVGHVDEALAFVQDRTSPHGWKAVLTAPREAWEILEGLVAKDPANGNVELFEGKSWGYETGFGTNIGEILEDPDLAAANDAAQAEADLIKELLMREAGLTEHDFVYLPFTWQPFSSGPAGEIRHVAHMPGMVNLQTFDGVALVPKPFGPIIGGEDVFERITRERLAPLGLDVRFVDTWDLYHLGLGEVHCGTQTDRTLPRDVRWWEVDR